MAQDQEKLRHMVKAETTPAFTKSYSGTNDSKEEEYR